MKTIAALFAAILIALTVAACAGQPTQETQTAPAAGTESQAQAPAAHQGEAAAPAGAPATHEGESAAPAEVPAAPQN